LYHALSDLLLQIGC